MSLRFHAALASTREMDPLRRDLGIDEGKWWKFEGTTKGLKSENHDDDDDDDDDDDSDDGRQNPEIEKYQ